MGGGERAGREGRGARREARAVGWGLGGGTRDAVGSREGTRPPGVQREKAKAAEARERARRESRPPKE